MAIEILTWRDARRYKKDLQKELGLPPTTMDMSKEACQKLADYFNEEIKNRL